MTKVEQTGRVSAEYDFKNCTSLNLRLFAFTGLGTAWEQHNVKWRHRGDGSKRRSGDHHWSLIKNLSEVEKGLKCSQLITPTPPCWFVFAQDGNEKLDVLNAPNGIHPAEFFSSKNLNLSEVLKCLKFSRLISPLWNVVFSRMGTENWIMKSLEKCCWNLKWFHCDIYFLYDIYNVIYEIYTFYMICIM